MILSLCCNTYLNVTIVAKSIPISESAALQPATTLAVSNSASTMNECNNGCSMLELGKNESFVASNLPRRRWV